MDDIPIKCTRCPEAKTFLLKKVGLDARMEELKSIADIVMQDTTDEQRENWAVFGGDASDLGVSAAEYRRRNSLAHSMDEIDNELIEEKEQLSKYLNLCDAGIIELSYVSNGQETEVIICGSKRVASQGVTWAEVNPVIPDEV